MLTSIFLNVTFINWTIKTKVIDCNTEDVTICHWVLRFISWNWTHHLCHSSFFRCLCRPNSQHVQRLTETLLHLHFVIHTTVKNTFITGWLLILYDLEIFTEKTKKNVNSEESLIDITCTVIWGRNILDINKLILTQFTLLTINWLEIFEYELHWH